MRRSTVLLAGLVSAFIVVNGINALRKGGDFTVFLDAGERFVAGIPLYSGSGVAAGVVGPPFQGVFFAPFALLARLDAGLARLAWYFVNLAALAWALMAWTSALGPIAGSRIRWHDWRPEPYGPVVLSLLAVSFPLQTNFEHQNMNLVLLALTGAAASALARDRDGTAGLLIGLASALKAFPGLLLVYLLLRRRWRAVAAGVFAACALTLLPAFQYGAGGMAAEIRDWLAISTSRGWPARGHNQSLFAMVARWYGAEGASDIAARSTPSHLRPHYTWMAAALCLVAVTFTALGPWWVRSERVTPLGIVAVLTLAVLLSPIAWDHYWVLLWPAFLFTCMARDRAWWVPWVFWIAAILTSGFSRAIVGAHGMALARSMSVFTWAGLGLLGGTLTLILQGRLAASGWRPANSLSVAASGPPSTPRQ